MALKFRALGGLLLIFASAIAAPAIAAEEEVPGYETTGETMERAFFENAANYFGSNSIRSNIDLIFGSGSLVRNSFPEHQIARDAQLVNIVYRDAFHQQVSNDPYLRTPDLPNPYSTSLLMSPQFNANKLKVGTEFRFEEISSR